MVFLDFVLLLFAFYLVTQIFLPLVFPQTFTLNWLFKKNKVEKLIYEKERIKREATNLYNQTEKDIAEIEKQKEELKKLNQN